MNNAPSGIVTFLFTDIEGSLKLALEHPDDMPALLARHHEILNQSIQTHDGYVFQIIGDAFCVAFSSAMEALNAAVDAQRSLQNEAWTPAPIKVAIGWEMRVTTAPMVGRATTISTVPPATIRCLATAVTT